MILLIDIGNTHTHVGLANRRRVIRDLDIPTSAWLRGRAPRLIQREFGVVSWEGVAFCSFVPAVNACVREWARSLRTGRIFQLTPRTLRGISVEYPQPNSIGADRLANALAACRRWGAPVVVVDFGTAVTLDVIDARGKYVGGVIAPGLSAMTDYLHEKTALLPKIEVASCRRWIGRSTEEAMQIGAVRGYRGLVRELIQGVKRELKTSRLEVVATGGYARLMSADLPAIHHVSPNLTLDGLRFAWNLRFSAK